MNGTGRMRWMWWGVLAAGIILVGVGDAHALVPECKGIYIDPEARCEVRAEAECMSSCDLDSMLSACAADLAATCSGECNFSASSMCTHDCGSTCEERCRVDDVVCESGCVDECTVTCPDECEPGDDECMEACEATCGQDCETKCAELPVDAKCLEHCNQCCVGSCTAQVNFDCQLQCQKPNFSNCRERLLDECEASCSGSGAMFCDGDFVAGEENIQQCLDALLNQSIQVRGAAEARASLDASTCNVGGWADEDGAGMAWVLLALGVLGMRRRRE